MKLMELLGFPPEPPPPPWDALPESYGYLDGSQPVVCTRAELVAICARHAIPRRVWTPTSRGPIATEEVDFLLSTLRRRLSRRPLRTALAIGAVGGSLVAVEASSGAVTAGSPAALYLAMTLALVAISMHSVWRARTLTPTGFRQFREEALRDSALRHHPVTVTPWLAAMMLAGALAQLWALWTAGGGAALGTFLAGTGELAVMPAAVSAERLQAGDLYTLVTAAFVHGGVLHLGLNLLGLVVLGRVAETYAGRGVLPVVFLASAVGGSLLSAALPPHLPSVGNSGALVGVIGFLGVFALRRPGSVPVGLLRGILLNVALLAAVGAAGYAYVDNACHAGGLVAGIAIGYLVIPDERAAPDWEPGAALSQAGRIAGATLAAAALLTIWLVARG